MGKSLKGKELGSGICQREDGTYHARFTDRFGKRQSIYAKTYSEIKKKLREKQYEDEKQINIVDTNIILDEWFEEWINTCKKNCRDTTKRTYRIQYNRLQKDLDWRKRQANGLGYLHTVPKDSINYLVRKINNQNPELHFEHFTPHCLRHTFTTNCIANGMKPKTLQKLLGHNSLQMTMDLYCHVLDDTIKEELGAFNEMA